MPSSGQQEPGWVPAPESSDILRSPENTFPVERPSSQLRLPAILADPQKVRWPLCARSCAGCRVLTQDAPAPRTLRNILGRRTAAGADDRVGIARTICTK
eukprot:scaffold18348_cov149-Isochrysis_galbana.AAC.4